MVVWLAFNSRCGCDKTEPDRCSVDELSGHFGGKRDMSGVVVTALALEIPRDGDSDWLVIADAAANRA